MFTEGIQKKVVVIACIAIAIASLTASIVIWKTHDSKPKELPSFPDPSQSELGIYEKAAVSCDAPVCSQIGKDVLQEGGNVADAAVATLFCMGVIQTQSMGIGGGFLMVLYNGTTKESRALIAREKAPIAATEDMFDGNPELSQRGPLAVAVPGELKGYWELYTKFGSGKIPWARLVAPTIKICREGFLVSKHAANALNEHRNRIKETPSMAEVFINNKTGEVFLQNDTMTRPVLANTLELIANAPEGGDILYTPGLPYRVMENFLEDLIDLGGIMQEADLTNYAVSWTDPIKVNLSNSLQMHSVPPPGSGILVSFMLKLISEYGLSEEILQDFDKSAVTYHRIAEIFKHAYAKRTYLGDPNPLVGDPDQVAQIEELIKNLTSTDYIQSIKSLIMDNQTNNTYEYYGAEFYQPENHGTSHLSIIGENGDAIAVTSTVNLYFGAAIRSRRTGIIYNDEMDDFSAPNITNAFGVPPSPANFIRPGKRPVSSMAPTIFTDANGQVRLVIGGAGGTQITTAVAYASIRNLWLNQTIKEAIDARRIHHQLYPMVLNYEPDFPQEYVTFFEGRKHETERVNLISSVVVGIARGPNGTIYANSDFRKEGTIAGY